MTGAGVGVVAGGPRRAVTRADVAKLAGVSTAVVSYVVNDGPRPVADHTAQRVRDAMEKLGYVPNASARALRRGRTETLGLVIADSLNPFFVQYAFELVTAASARGMRVLIGESREDLAQERSIIEELVARQVDGLLLASSFSRHPDTYGLAVPTVLIDCPGPIPGRLTVGSAAEAAAEELVGHLVSHGRRRVGLIIGEHGFGDPDPRERGWRTALMRAGLEPGPVVRVPFSREGGYEGAVQLLAVDSAVDAIFASNDLQGIGALLALNERGVAVPGDVAVGAFDGTKEAEFCWPPLTVAQQQLTLLAGAALDLVGAGLADEGAHVEIPTVLIRRASCGCGDTMINPAR
ncbi:MAG TPA: LacI family DNA-binding transcriptional regulator [Propionicimonas sp.]